MRTSPVVVFVHTFDVDFGVCARISGYGHDRCLQTFQTMVVLCAPFTIYLFFGAHISVDCRFVFAPFTVSCVFVHAFQAIV